MSGDFLDKLSHLAQNAVSRLVVRSALNPLLWFCGIITPICIAGAWGFKDDRLICLILICAGVAPILLTILVAAYFAICKTDKLQSEDYQIRSQSLQLVREKGGRIAIDPASLQSIANPTVPAAKEPHTLPLGEEEAR